MDADLDLREAWQQFQEEQQEPEAGPSAHADPADQKSPEALRNEAFVLSTTGERREAVDMLRRALSLAESIGVEPTRMIPLLEAMSEVLWQMGEKREARMCANRALQLWFALRPSAAFELAGDDTQPF